MKVIRLTPSDAGYIELSLQREIDRYMKLRVPNDPRSTECIVDLILPRLAILLKIARSYA